MSSNGTTIQLRIQSIIDGVYKHGVDLIYIPADKTLEALEILMEAERRLKQLRNDDMSEM